MPEIKSLRLFTKFRMPTWIQLFFYIAIISTVLFAALVPAGSLHWRTGLSLWSHPELGAQKEMSAAMIWLLAANLTSFLAVLLLFLELRKLERMTRGLALDFDRERVKSRLGCSDKTITKIAENPLRWALRPLEFMYGISVSVMLATAGVWIAIYLSRPVVATASFTALILFTGLIYLGLMTVGDLLASRAYKRATCLRGDNLEFSHLVEALSDYERLLKYVDGPILLSMLFIILHKFLVLQVASLYQLGFFAGSIAMHTIIANIISIVIAASYVEVKSDVVEIKNDAS